jgi:hypothetical protein
MCTILWKKRWKNPFLHLGFEIRFSCYYQAQDRQRHAHLKIHYQAQDRPKQVTAIALGPGGTSAPARIKSYGSLKSIEKIFRKCRGSQCG